MTCGYGFLRTRRTRGIDLRIRCLVASDYGQYGDDGLMLASARAIAEVPLDPLDNLGTLGRELIIA